MDIAPPTIKRPPPKNKPLKNKHRVPIVVAVIGAAGLIVAALIPVLLRPSSEPMPQVPAPTSTAPEPGPVPPPSPSPAAVSATPTPPEPTETVRRSTHDKPPLTLTTGYSADLDATTLSWDVQYSASNSRFDIRYSYGSINGVSAGDFAVVTGPAVYETCLTASGYARSIRRNEIQPGVTACARTSEKRYAFVTIKKLVPRDNPKQIQLDVTVWDPPFEES